MLGDVAEETEEETQNAWASTPIEILFTRRPIIENQGNADTDTSKTAHTHTHRTSTDEVPSMINCDSECTEGWRGGGVG
jgi:hypothetical protein